MMYENIAVPLHRCRLFSLLEALEGVEQDPVWHPEGDALFHSLQVFDVARAHTPDRELWAAALLHDVGKGRGAHHERIGAHLLSGWLPPRVVWLVAHHLDLLVAPAKTRRRWRGSARLADLQQLRDWDVAGRDPWAMVPTLQEAVAAIEEVVVQP